MKIKWVLPGHSCDGMIDEVVLKTPLPADRNYEDAPATYGDYVGVMEALFGKGAGFLERLLQKSGHSDAEVTHLSISILKHGHFYHPAKMVVSLSSGKDLCFVINLAVTEKAVACIKNEFQLFDMLCQRSEALPEMYLLEEVSSGGHHLAVMVGQWFEGYWEFHQTRQTGRGEVVVWAEPHHVFLTESKALNIYKKSAEILTRLYNPKTFEAVQPWHHAAGDFVLSLDRDDLDIKLITVRQYTAIADVDEKDPEDYLEAALLFFMLLSFRNRLDRCDGIGEVAWIEGAVVQATLNGFLKGLKGRKDVGPFEGEFGEWVRLYFKKQDTEDLMGCAAFVVNSLNPEASEMETLKKHFSLHVEEVAAEIATL